MAHAYTPGLKVLENTSVEKERRLPLKGEVLVDKGTDVSPEKIVARTHLPGNVQMVNVANLLNVDAQDVPGFMLIDIGKNVSKDDLLAETKGLFGLFKSEVKSPVDGVVESVSSVTGQVVIREAPVPVEVDAYMNGNVSEIMDKEGVVITSNAVFIQGIFGMGGENRGNLRVLVNDREDELNEEMITADMKGSVIVGGSYISLKAFKKAISVGVSAVVVGGFNYHDLKEILGYTLGVAITGSEDIGTSLILTEGYGKIPMGSRSFDILKKHDGNFTSVNGATQIRAGVIRPEIVIPINNVDDLDSNVKKNEMGITEGSLVRVIRSPYFGQIGTVKALPHELHKMESETMVRVAEVEINDQKFVIPRANLEMVETN
ncbi:MAG: hypothetical protein CMG15_08565 [Candidatus Marinimicrobia bacterium]|nr:hypothetical protein [Candidatus Neomarinimicrobiota bacterium]MEC7935892.1 hypothetical protein [Candidatus Neomarinimicrobiota bacterium]|tara:strand:+ start:8610 stop:9734 length:1125 start_codon:yes stop_codon:yes gene_type:complete